MNFHRLSVAGALIALCLLGSCAKKKLQDPQLPLTNASYENAPQPINLVIKTDESLQGSGYAPVADVPLETAVPAAPVVGDVAPFPPPPPFPPLGGVLVDDDDCEGFCGDGIRQDSEDCDDADDDDNNSCDRYCRIPVCGNGKIEGTEECDAPDNIYCTSSCTLVLCGNSVLDAGETCDPPNSTTCNATCLLSVCGNGIVELGEECDDANTVEDDGCSNSCELSCPVP